MTRRDAWFLISLPFAALADACAAWLEREDTRLADSLNGADDDD